MELHVGIDPSAKKIAIVGHIPVMNTLYAESHPLYAKGQTKQDVSSLVRAAHVMRQFVIWADRNIPNGPRVAWVETPLVGRGGVTTTLKQGYIGGIIRAELAEGGFEVRDVNVSTWKKTIVGNGRAEKPLVAQALKQAWPKASNIAGADGDLIDAAAICLHGIRQWRHEGSHFAPSYQSASVR